MSKKKKSQAAWCRHLNNGNILLTHIQFVPDFFFCFFLPFLVLSLTLYKAQRTSLYRIFILFVKLLELYFYPLVSHLI